MSTRWHNLSLIFGLTAIGLSGACGGRSDQNGSAGGSAGAPLGHGGASSGGVFSTSGGSNAVLGGAPGTGGWLGSGGELHAGSPGFGGAPGSGGAASGGITGRGGEGHSGGSAPFECRGLLIQIGQGIEAAKACNPLLSTEQCTQLIPGGVPCSCPTFANPTNKDAIDEVNRDAQAYAKLGCALGIACGACLQPVRGYCSPEGRCEDSVTPQPRSCKVAGVVYPSGSTQIKDPEGSCNTCSCDDGVLSCTLRDCPSTGCPSGTALGQGCAECGPTDGCVLPEYDCYPVCTTTCSNPNQICLNGLCRTGFCG